MADPHPSSLFASTGSPLRRARWRGVCGLALVVVGVPARGQAVRVNEVESFLTLQVATGGSSWAYGGWAMGRVAAIGGVVRNPYSGFGEWSLGLGAEVAVAGAEVSTGALLARGTEGTAVQMFAVAGVTRGSVTGVLSTAWVVAVAPAGAPYFQIDPLGLRVSGWAGLQWGANAYVAGVVGEPFAVKFGPAVDVPFGPAKVTVDVLVGSGRPATNVRAGLVASF